jgi:serine phosphatase RsbU (regulator of sigma subunit)
MDGQRDILPPVRDIMVPTRGIPSSLKVSDVVEAFRNDLSLRVLPLVAGERCVGSISRRNLFFRHLSRKYASDLFGNKPIEVLKDEKPLLMASHLDITHALECLLETDPLLETDAFLIMEGERCLGSVAVSDLMMRISESQRRLLDTLRSLSARIREEVDHAREIQRDLLPDPAFRFNGISVAAGMITSTEIGGDFYDYFICGDNRLGLVIADVSGHGVQSGMVTTAAKASLHTLLSFGVSTPAGLLSGMNRAIMATARRRLLMTCFIAVIDLRKRRVDFANAGHNFPYLFRRQSGELELLDEATGFPLGFDEDTEFPEYATGFGSGDCLVLYTDGIVECRDTNSEELGYERMERLILKAMGGTPDGLARALLDGAGEFAGTPALEDDATVLVAGSVPD